MIFFGGFISSGHIWVGFTRTGIWSSECPFFDRINSDGEIIIFLNSVALHFKSTHMTIIFEYNSHVKSADIHLLRTHNRLHEKYDSLLLVIFMQLLPYS